ncbi:hypothetical protein pipiens_020203, partial [Culex pipiens pipiens]
DPAPPNRTICYSDRGRRWGIPYAILEGVDGFELTG